MAKLSASNLSAFSIGVLGVASKCSMKLTGGISNFIIWIDVGIVQITSIITLSGSKKAFLSSFASKAYS
jgi:hypothetical protein